MRSRTFVGIVVLSILHPLCLSCSLYGIDEYVEIDSLLSVTKTSAFFVSDWCGLAEERGNRNSLRRWDLRFATTSIQNCLARDLQGQYWNVKKKMCTTNALPKICSVSKTY